MVTKSSVRNFECFIDGADVLSKSGLRFENKNPANQQEILGSYPRGGAVEIDLAVKAAQAAFPGWAAATPPVRGRILVRAAEILLERKEELARVIVSEMGKTLPESRGDVQSAVDMAYFVAGEGRRLYGSTTTSELPQRWALTRRVPVGVCGLITAWNAPIATPAWKIFPALLCGNTIVFKPAEDTPESAHWLVKILHEAGLPKGVLNLVYGLGEEAGAALVHHPDVKLLSFTGSSEVGRFIAETGAKRLAKVSLELGGKNAAVIMDDADLGMAVSGVVAGAFSVAGQRCAATSRVIVHEKIYDQFINRLLAATSALKIGNGLDAKTNVCPVINDVQLLKIDAYVKSGVKEGAKLLVGGRTVSIAECPQGLFYEPTIFVDVNPRMKIAQEEIFGPVLCVFKAKSFEEAIALHNDVPYGLTASLFTSNINLALKGLDRLEAGVCYINAPTFGSEVHMPFGGVKQSGNGHREAGMGGIDVFSETKTIYMDYSSAIQNAQYQNTEGKK